MDGEKKCLGCGEVKPLEKFYRRKDAIDGKHSRCKDCHKLYNEEARSRRHGPRAGKSLLIVYRVVYDPWDSFTPRSAFTRKEIYSMIKLGFLAVNTTFKRVKDGALYKVSQESKLELIQED